MTTTEQKSPPDKEDLGGYSYVKYDVRLTDFARKNRQKPTPAEFMLWEAVLSNSQLMGYRFLRQKPLRHFIADFYCSKLLLVVEIDGDSHSGHQAATYDQERTEHLDDSGIRVVRYTNGDVLNRIDYVREELEKEVHTRIIELDI